MYDAIRHALHWVFVWHVSRSKAAFRVVSPMQRFHCLKDSDDDGSAERWPLAW